MQLVSSSLLSYCEAGSVTVVARKTGSEVAMKALEGGHNKNFSLATFKSEQHRSTEKQKKEDQADFMLKLS